MWRSLLFVPILNDRLVASAGRRGADAIVLDLEAAVPLNRKTEARDLLADVIPPLKASHADIAVRINPFTADGETDVRAALTAGADVIVLPHATPDSVVRLTKLLDCTPLIALIESPRSVIEALQIADAKGVAGLGLGVEDYAAAMGAPPTPDLLTPAAFQVIQAARAADRAPLVLPDTIADFADLSRFEAAAVKAKSMGASGGFAIHPRQVEILNRVFAPTPTEVADAQTIIEAAEEARQDGDAVAKRVGQMIDAPVEARARRVLDLYRRYSK